MEFNFNRIKGERIAKGFTIQEMADALGITNSAYSKKENGRIALTVKELTVISNKLGIDDVNIFFEVSAS